MKSNKPLRQKPEAEIKKHVLVRLSELGAFAWNAPAGVFINPRSVCEQCARRAQRVRVGVPGQPDTMALFPEAGTFVGVEIKREGGRQSDRQRAWERRCHNVGGRYILVRDVDELEAALADLGLY